MTPFEERLTNMIEPPLVGMGYDLVRVMMRGDMRKTLQIMAERQDERGMTLEDCEKISETISAILDVHDPIKERYALEVSSPGIDRPLSKQRDYERYLGFEAKIDLKIADNNRKHYKGILRSADANGVTIELEKAETYTASYDMIQKAKLVLTDELIDAHLKAQAAFEEIDQNPISIDSTDQPAVNDLTEQEPEEA